MKIFNKIAKVLICLLICISITGCNSKNEDAEVTEEEIVVEQEDAVESETTSKEQAEEKNIEVEEVDEETNYLFSYSDDTSEYGDEVTPHRFRSVKTELKKAERYGTDYTYVPSLEGFYNTKISGSAQFSTDQFESLVGMLEDLAGSNKIYIVDLRKENHLFIDGISVSWPEAEEDLSSEEVLANEDELEEQLKEALPDHEIKSEKELVEEYGLNYIRIACKDSCFPSDKIVEEFLDIVGGLSKNSWLHFHCKEGKGRTTTFMTLYDIYRNRNVSLKDIGYREYCIGGIYVLYDGCNLDINDPDRPNWEERERKVRMFYDYMTMYSKQSWSDWYKDNDDYYE